MRDTGGQGAYCYIAMQRSQRFHVCSTKKRNNCSLLRLTNRAIASFTSS